VSCPVSQHAFLQKEGEVWQNDDLKCGRSDGPITSNRTWLLGGVHRDADTCGAVAREPPTPGEQVKTKEIIERSQRYPEVDEAQRQRPAVAKKELTAKDNL
jgi:hypothetical protein